MINLLRYVFVFVVLLAVMLPMGFAAEVRNLRSGQDGKRAFVQYDLAGMPGEKEADVSVAVEVGGKKYKAERLSLSGDFGRGVKIGIGRKVYWDLLKDMPSGFEGEIGWEIDATSTVGFIAAVKAEEARKAKELAEKRRIALQKAEEERLAKEKAEQLRVAAEKAEIARLAAVKAEEARKAKELAEQRRIALQKAEEERLAKEKAELERKSAEKAEQDRIASAKVEKDREIYQRPIEVPTQDTKTGMEFEKDGLRFYKDVVVDTRSGLMWVRNANIAGKKMDWSDATKWVEGGVFSARLEYAGHRDWRLPTQEELSLLAERGGSRPSEWFNSNGFKNVQADWYWSGTENGSYGGRGFEGVAMAFDMTSGNAYSDGKNNQEYVWPVRSATVQQDKMTGEKVEKNRLAKDEAVIELPTGYMSDKEKQVALELERTTVGEMVSVPAGCFTPGGTQVCLDAFRIGTFEVTQRQWLQLMDSRSYFKNCGGDCPVENISWNMIQEFLQKLNSQTGKKYRLPTEAEWHYACTSGGKSEDYCGGNDLDALAWRDKNSVRKTHPVGLKQPNGFGIYDMSGNVWEWVSDWYGDTYPTGSRNPNGASSGDRKVVRGGSWLADSEELRADYRYAIDPNVWISDIGFRLAENTTAGQVSALPEKKKKDKKKVFSLRDKVVVDHLTGLMWTRNGKLSPEKLSFGGAKSFIKKLNSENYAGYSNWRMPSIAEFNKLYSSAKIMAGESKKPLDVIRETFIDYQLWHYWTRDVANAAWFLAFAFDLEDGTAKWFPENEIHYVLAVR